MQESHKALISPVILFAIVLATGCGSPLPPSSTAVGEFEGAVVPGHFQSLTLCIAQTGADLAGTGRLVDGSDVVFANAPVIVSYPDVSLAVPGNANVPAGFAFNGRFQQDGKIAGHSRFGSGPATDMTLARVPTRSATACAGL